MRADVQPVDTLGDVVGDVQTEKVVARRHVLNPATVRHAITPHQAVTAAAAVVVVVAGCLVDLDLVAVFRSQHVQFVAERRQSDNLLTFRQRADRCTIQYDTIQNL